MKLHILGNSAVINLKLYGGPIFMKKELAVTLSSAVFFAPMTALADTYKVEFGDNLWNISKTQNKDFNEVWKLNNQINNKDLIYKNQLIQLPPTTIKKATKTYKVVVADNLWLIAQKKQVDFAALLKANPQIKNKNLIYPGQEINLPATFTDAKERTKATKALDGANAWTNKKEATKNLPSHVATNKKQPAKKKTTKVLAGATLWSIAKDNHVSVPELVKANPQIKDKNLIYKEQTLTIPSKDAKKQKNENVTAAKPVVKEKTPTKSADKDTVKVPSNPVIKDTEKETTNPVIKDTDKETTTPATDDTPKDSSGDASGSVGSEEPIEQPPTTEDTKEEMPDKKGKQAKVEFFDLLSNDKLDAYDKVFKVATERIAAVTNNGGKYASSELKYATDNDTTTHWETGKKNSEDFTNEVNFTFTDIETINRIVYTPRPGGKGFAQAFDIYGSMTEDGEDFGLVSQGTYTRSVTDTVEITFDETKFKRLKFVFTKANQDWAAAGEFSFYEEDVVRDKMAGLFTDNTQSKVSKAFNTNKKLDALEKAAKTHPLYTQYKEDIELARRLLNGEVDTAGRIITSEQRGNMASYSQNVLKMPFGSNSQPTGIAARVGDKITIYVEAGANDPLPQVLFTQQQGNWNAWDRSFNLHVGKNVLTVPQMYDGNVTQGGPIYIVNPYTSENQSKAPVVRIEGGERFPLFEKGGNVAEFKTFLKDYQTRLATDVAVHPDVKDREMIDVAEVMSDRILFTGTASEAYKQYVTNAINPQKTAEGYDVWIKRIFDFSGLDSSMPEHDPQLVRENIRYMQSFGSMYAAGNHTGIQAYTIPFLFSSDFSKTYPGWGLTHEIGHRMAVGMREYGEVTNNMVSMAMSVEYNSLDNRIPFETIYQQTLEENKVQMADQSLTVRLGTFWQLELAHPGYWAELNKLYREEPISLSDGDATRQQYIVTYSSRVLKKDLSNYFARHGFTVNDETRKETSKYAQPKKLWYLNNKVLDYKGTGFSTGVKPNVTMTHSTTKNVLGLSMDDAQATHLLGYEIYRNGELIAFTANPNYTDETSEAATYDIIAYDKKLGTTKATTVKAQ